MRAVRNFDSRSWPLFLSVKRQYHTLRDRGQVGRTMIYAKVSPDTKGFI